ncbi:MAG TPA: VOC family protein [Pyrinomonadaceae bacterium]|nr:VOC family protein [Pyrinomonadaceae bacterium]
MIRIFWEYQFGCPRPPGPRLYRRYAWHYHRWKLLSVRRSDIDSSALGQLCNALGLIIGVHDVSKSFEWYQTLFGQSATRPAHDYFGQIVDTDGTVMLCLHAWGEHEHPSLTSPETAAPGNGLLLFFRVDNFNTVLQSARELVAQFEEGPNTNPKTGTPEFSLRDPDGYYVTISAYSELELS